MADIMIAQLAGQQAPAAPVNRTAQEAAGDDFSTQMQQAIEQTSKEEAVGQPEEETAQQEEGAAGEEGAQASRPEKDSVPAKETPKEELEPRRLAMLMESLMAFTQAPAAGDVQAPEVLFDPATGEKGVQLLARQTGEAALQGGAFLPLDAGAAQEAAPQALPLQKDASGRDVTFQPQTQEEARFVEGVLRDVEQLSQADPAKQEASSGQADTQTPARSFVKEGQAPGEAKAAPLPEQQASKPVKEEGTAARAEAGAASLASSRSAVVQLPLQAGEPLLPTAPVREALVTQVVEQIQSSVNESESQLSIQLKPDVLGGLSIKLSMGADGLRAQITTQDRQVHMLVNDQIFQLQEALKDRGIQVVRMEVLDLSMAGNFSQANPDRNRQGYAPSGQGRSAADVPAARGAPSLYAGMVLGAGGNTGMEFTA